MARHAVMVRQLCVLQPFAPDISPPLLVRVEAVWQASGAMAFSFGLRPGPGWDSLEGLRISSRTGLPQRRDGLWDHTCFEAFLGWLNRRTTGSSTPLPTATGTSTPSAPTAALRSWWICPSHLGLSCAVRPGICAATSSSISPPCWPEAMQPEIGLAMVVEEQEDRLSYWALSHPGDQPDFHDRRAFLPT